MSYSWDSAVLASGMDPKNIATVDRRDGENDEASWLAMGETRDGRWWFISAWCDYTGWGCRAGGDHKIAATRDELVRLCMGEDDRAALLGEGSCAGPWQCDGHTDCRQHAPLGSACMAAKMKAGGYVASDGYGYAEAVAS